MQKVFQAVGKACLSCKVSINTTQIQVKMAKVYEFLADGFEDIEALLPVDVLRRGGVEVVTVSVSGAEIVTSAHGVGVKADCLFEQVGSFEDADLLLLPGGMPGAKHLNAHQGVRDALLKQFNSGRKVGAICAAPMVLGSLGVLKGRQATCYPGFEQYLEGAEYTADKVTADGNLTTGNGPGAAPKYAFTLLAQLTSPEKAAQVKAEMQFVCGCHKA